MLAIVNLAGNSNNRSEGGKDDLVQKVKKRKSEHQEEVFLSETGREMTLSSFDLLPKRAHEVQVPRRPPALLLAPLPPRSMKKTEE